MAVPVPVAASPTHAARPDLLPSGQRQRLILRLLRHPGQKQLRRILARQHPADVAQLFPLVPPAEQQRLIEILMDLRLAARVFRELDGESQRQVLDTLPEPQLAAIVTRLSAPDAVDLLERLPEPRRQALLGQLEPALATHLHNLQRYGPATAGGLMNPDVISFPGAQSVAATLQQIRELAEERRLFYLYVIDERRHLLGIVNLWQLVTADGERRLRDLMNSEVVTVRVDTPEDEVARVFSRYDLLLVPVVDEDGKLSGSITVDDVLDVVEEAATADLYHLANLDTQEALATPAVRSVRLRLPWLLINLATAFLAAGVVSLFQETIAKYVVLAVFMPIVAGMGGNAGTQTLTVMVRGLALGEMDLRRTAGVLFKQTAVGLMNGLATGIVLGAVAWLWERNALLGAILCLAETVNLTVAGLFGAAVPLALRRLRLDPALGSSIFVTTATDVCGFFSFLGTATLLIGLLQP